VDHTVYEEPRCARDPASRAARGVLVDAAGVDALPELSVEAFDVEPDRLRVAAELGIAQLVLMREEAIVHLPEPSLRAGGLGGLRRGGGTGMQIRHRKVPEHEPEPVAEALEQVQHHGIGLAAVRALEVAVLDQRHGGVGRAAHVISRDIDGRGERCSLHIGTIPSMPGPGDIEAEIDRLYGLPLDEFVKARDELARSLRQADRRSDAATVKELRKPTVGAWALNQAARTRRDDLRELLEAGDALRVAQERLLAGGDRGELRDATERERELVSRLAQAAAVIGGEAGRSATLEPRLRATLHAASLDESVRGELAAGRLVREREPVALGALAVGEAEPESGPAKRATGRRKAAEPRRAARGRGRARAEDPDAQRAERLAELEDRVREARERAEAAAGALSEAEQDAADARERAKAAAAELGEAERAERAAGKAVQDAERAQRAARKDVRGADDAKRAARKAVAEAERAAKRLAREAEQLLAADAKPRPTRRRRRG
jgi:hypothetical protein